MHPAKMTFQALRIAVNREYEELRLGLEASLNLLADYGKVCEMCDIPVKTTVRLLKTCQGGNCLFFFPRLFMSRFFVFVVA
jgi:hypothetical protein